MRSLPSEFVDPRFPAEEIRLAKGLAPASVENGGDIPALPTFRTG